MVDLTTSNLFFCILLFWKYAIARWGTNNLHCFCFCFSDSPDWADYDEKLKGNEALSFTAPFPSGEFEFFKELFCVLVRRSLVRSWKTYSQLNYVLIIAAIFPFVNPRAPNGNIYA
jgi:hypothetical protein